MELLLEMYDVQSQILESLNIFKYITHINIKMSDNSQNTTWLE